MKLTVAEKALLNFAHNYNIWQEYTVIKTMSIVFVLYFFRLILNYIQLSGSVKEYMARIG